MNRLEFTEKTLDLSVEVVGFINICRSCGGVGNEIANIIIRIENLCVLCTSA